MKKFTWSIGNRFLIPSVFVILISLTVVTFVTTHYINKGFIENLNNEIFETAKIAAVSTDIWLVQNKGKIESDAADEEIRDFLLGRNSNAVNVNITRRLVVQKKAWNSAVLCVLDKKGKVVLASSAKKIGAGYKDREYFKRAVQTKKIVISKPLISRTTGKPAIVICSPVFSKSKVVGAVFGTFDLYNFSKENIAPIKVGEKGYCYIITSDGKVLSHPDEKNIDVKKSSKYQFTKDIIKTKYGNYGYDFKGVKKLSGISILKSTDWLVVATIDQDESRVISDNIRNIMFIMSFGMIIVVIIMLFYISKGITRPIIKLVEDSALLAEGDFRIRFEPGNSDEVVKLSESLNTVVENLETIFSEVIRSSADLTGAVEQIAKGNETLSSRTSQQASTIEEIVATVEEAAASTINNAENSLEANKIALTASELAVTGGEKLNVAVGTINAISESSKKMADIITVINEIAFQTNLLALNAAVEAARAGDQGRGFAVVAGEVRNLAQRSGEAAKEIGDMIKDSVSKIETGTEQVNESAISLNEIIEAARQVGFMVGKITDASNEQKAGMVQIQTALNEMDEMIQQNSSLVEETASSSEEMTGRADNLQQMVGQFKVRDGREDS